MSQRLGGQDCPRTCTGRDLDKTGAQIPCEHNGFVGVPLARVVEYGRSAQKEGIRADLSSGVDKRRWKAPSLKPEGRAFKPGNATSGVPVGSLVSWPVGGRVGARRSGQVWSGHPRAGAIWVAPDDGGPAVALNAKTLELL